MTERSISNGSSGASNALLLSSNELDKLYRSGTVGDIPTGRSRGTALTLPGSTAAPFVVRVVRLLFWKGKDFDPVQRDLLNRLSPFGARLIRAKVEHGTSLLDGKPCIVLDYSQTSKVAGFVRDEIRQVGPQNYLGLVYVRNRLIPLRFWLDFS